MQDTASHWLKSAPFVHPDMHVMTLV